MPPQTELSPAETLLAADEVVPRLRIDIDRAPRGGFLHGRHDLWIRGRVIADVPVEQVSLRVGRRVLSTLRYGRADGAAAEHVFTFSLSRLAAEAAAPCLFAIAALGEAGSASEDFVVAPDPDGDGGGSVVVQGPTAAAAEHAGAAAPIMLYVERAGVDRDGQLLVQGWALARTAIVAVHVSSGEARIGAALLGRARGDVAQAYPGYPNAAASGFVFTARLGDEWRRMPDLRIEAVSLGGAAQEVICRIEPPERAAEPEGKRGIRMFCDDATLTEGGHLEVAGWAVCAVGIARVEVRLDGELAGEAELALPRADVADIHRAIPMARYSGFRFARQMAGAVRGAHEVTVTAVNGLDDVRIETVAVEASAAGVAPMGGGDGAFRLEVDMPELVGGAVGHPVAGLLTIQGWSLARAKIVAVEVFVDGVRKGEAHYGLSRPDVAEAYPERADALRSGFVFLCPLRGLANGPHTIRLAAKAADGQIGVKEFRINVLEDTTATGYAQIRRHLPPAQANLYRELLARAAPLRPFVLLLRMEGSADGAELAVTLRSLAAQVYQDWRLVLLGEGAENLLAGPFSAFSGRVQVGWGELGEAWCGFLSPGDELGADALAEIALFATRNPGAEVIYADESRTSPVSGVREAFFKPGWSPDLLLSTNYIGRPWFVSGKLLERAGATPEILAKEGEFGLILRCTEASNRVLRLPRLLCRRGAHDPDTPEQEAAALAAGAGRGTFPAEVLPGCTSGTWRLRRGLSDSPLVSIIIPTCGAGAHIETCIETLRRRTAWRQYEIICIDNIPAKQRARKTWLRGAADRIVLIPDRFNWSRFNNLAVQHADGEFLLFLNDDIEITQDDWLDAMMEHAQRPEVGVVGPQLLYPDGKVQHAGMFLSTPGLGRHAFRMLEGDDPGYFGLARTQRNVIAVTGACMLARRDSFAALGGFDEAHEIVNNDLDYCLRAHAAGQRIVFTPHASLIHHELASRDRMEDVFDSTRFIGRWQGMFAAGDPFFSPRLQITSDDYRPDDEPAQEVFAGHPLFERDSIRRILAVKLDHIGDFLTGLPALRRLRDVFPGAELHVLAGRAARAFAEMTDGIDGFIEFDFFHARSELGPRELAEDDFRALAARLLPYGFDLAVDLRMHPDTRAVLRHIPARLRAGYDHAGQFPFLDIALEWDKDSPLQRKRTHVSDRLLNLVDAIATASAPQPQGTPLRVGDPAELLARLPANARRLFRRPVAAVHPGVGNTARQWPAAHYAALCDLLATRSGLNVVLIGGPDERQLAAAVLRQVTQPRAVISLAGRTPLKDLPLLLRACALYVGNNSGPKHIAASLGVPTIGIHSGVVDAVEWGPLGERAMALQRNMLCKPCYLLKAADCPRGMACLEQLTPAVVHLSCETLLGGVAPGPANRGGRPKPIN